MLIENTYSINLAIAILKILEGDPSEFTVNDLKTRILDKNKILPEDLKPHERHNLHIRILANLHKLRSGNYIKMETRETPIKTKYYLISAL